MFFQRVLFGYLRNENSGRSGSQCDPVLFPWCFRPGITRESVGRKSQMPAKALGNDGKGETVILPVSVDSDIEEAVLLCVEAFMILRPKARKAQTRSARVQIPRICSVKGQFRISGRVYARLMMERRQHRVLASKSDEPADIVEQVTVLFQQRPDRKSTRLNSSHPTTSRMPSSA